MDMTEDIFATTTSGQLALKKMFKDREMPENFRLYCGNSLGEPGNTAGIHFIGAEFRVAKSGPNKGLLSIKIPDTDVETVVTKEEVQRFEEEQ